MERPARPPRRSWAPALLAGHAVLAGVVTAVSLALLALGTGARDGVDAEGPARVGTLLVAAAVVLVTAARVGRGRPGRTARWWSVVALWTLAPWCWVALYASASTPALTAGVAAVLPLLFWPGTLLALVLGVVAASVLVGLDR